MLSHYSTIVKKRFLEFLQKEKILLRHARLYYPVQFSFVVGFGVALSLSVFVYGVWFRPPQTFPLHSFVKIEEGSSLIRTANELYEQGIIRSPRTFVYMAILLGGERSIQAGDYFLSDPQNVYRLAARVVKGEYGITPERLTIPEGSDIYDIADLLASRYPSFDPITFLASAEKYEGHLFPDTYYVYPNLTADKALTLLRSNFEKQIFNIADDIETFGHPLEDIITIASIVEREASNEKDRKMIAGIIWNRLAKDMPLQVDVTFRYINGKTTYDLTIADLLEDNPYNTYVNKGLPPTPIANPSLESILATIHYTESDYVYFLADRRGNTYFSKTYDEHLRKKRMYVD